jgi:DNA-binding Lrp family transcriptional regulator
MAVSYESAIGCDGTVTIGRRRYVAVSRIFRHIDGEIVGVTMTEKDEELLGFLRVNAREPVAALARKLGVSRTTVQDRLKRLEDSGIIAGYAVKLGAAAKVPGMSAMITLGIEPRQQIDVAKTIGTYPQVETLHTVSGKFDLVAVVKTATSEDMDRLIDKIGMLKGVTDIETAVILSTKLDRR